MLLMFDWLVMFDLAVAGLLAEKQAGSLRQSQPLRLDGQGACTMKRAGDENGKVCLGLGGFVRRVFGCMPHAGSPV